MKDKILLVDDHPIVREGIKRSLGDEWDICGEAGNGKEAIEKVLELKPDLALMDVSMPLMNGIEATKQIRLQSPETRVILLSMHETPQIGEAAKKAGADGYLVKTGTVEELRETIRTVLRTRVQ